MVKEYSVEVFLDKLQENGFVKSSHIPMGFGPGLPMFGECNGKLCLQVLYWRCKVTGEKNKNLIYPVRYVLMFTIPEGIPVYMYDLKYNRNFRTVDFEKPIGFFPNKNLQGIKKDEYMGLRGSLLKTMSYVVNDILNGLHNHEQEKELKEIYKKMIDPSLCPFYNMVNKKFFEKYIA